MVSFREGMMLRPSEDTSFGNKNCRSATLTTPAALSALPTASSRRLASNSHSESVFVDAGAAVSAGASGGAGWAGPADVAAIVGGGCSCVADEASAGPEGAELRLSGSEAAFEGRFASTSPSLRGAGSGWPCHSASA